MSGSPFHLAWFLAGGYGVKSWNKTWSGDGGYNWADPQLFVDLARAIERACFDYMIIEDSSYVPDAYGSNSKAYLDNAVAVPKLDPTVLAPVLAQATERLGIVTTMSTTEYHPYMLARKIASMDHLSKGRIGWNIVTSSSDRAAQNYGHDKQPEHDSRYDMADEFFDLACRLWDSWEPDAVRLDEENGVWADYTKVHTVDFEGKHFKSRGPLVAGRSPQGRPVFVQAGGSERGREFAASTANSIISGTGGGPAGMKKFRDGVHERMTRLGRPVSDCKVLFLISPVLGETDAEAREKRDRMSAYAEEHPEMGLLHLSRHSGIDFSKFPVDEPIPEDATTNGHQQMLAQVIGRTPREVLRQDQGLGGLDLVGSPDTVAAQMAEAMQEVGGDGFLIASQDLNRRYISEITDGLVPALRRRGVVRTEYTHDRFRDNLLAF
jgi:long-chain alkane monooxygenase